MSAEDGRHCSRYPPPVLKCLSIRLPHHSGPPSAVWVASLASPVQAASPASAVKVQDGQEHPPASSGSFLVKASGKNSHSILEVIFQENSRGEISSKFCWHSILKVATCIPYLPLLSPSSTPQQLLCHPVSSDCVLSNKVQFSALGFLDC